MRELSINNFKREVEVTYRDEKYLVRDNGAICSIPKPNQKKRRLDGVWTFGNQCRTNGYRRIRGIVVHKIVATAFHGEQPSPQHVVDHLDTNRRNNRVENLRWVTRLENITNNPKTLRRVEQIWGSVEGMLKDPYRAEKVEPLGNRSWMPQKISEIIFCNSDTESFTPLAVQRNWKTPNAFPLCPDEISDQPLKDYFERLTEDSIFSHNRFGETLIKIATLSDDGQSISLITNIIDGVKGWGLARVTFEGGRFVHEACGTCFSLEGAQKRHCEMTGQLWMGGDSIDDYC